uniref:RSE1/DDB1/CPSF1 C-terminal domain-containing protein n=1 Tax=Paramoeba aestuarina TaxID=180227 RepID=A0A7S4L7E9_9EUKA
MEVADEKSSEAKEEERKQLAESYARQRKAVDEKNASHHWASCLRVVDLRGHQTVSTKEMEKGTGCYSICLCTFLSRPNMRFVVVGTAKEMDPVTRKAAAYFIELYSFNEENGSLSLFEKTQVEAIPTAVCPFQGKLLVGIGKTLRLYDLGKKKLVRKCENSQFATSIYSIHTSGQRIYVSDVSQSVFFCVYRRPENAITVVALDSVPRWVTSTELLDHDTVACGDRFGNVSILRLRAEHSDAISDQEQRGTDHLALTKLDGKEDGWTGRESGFSVPYKLDCLVNFHVGDVITSISKSTVVSGASEVLLYTTLFGGIGALLPVILKEDIIFLKKLETLMRNYVRPLCGHDHLSYRSSYGLAQGVVDGDLCEQYWSLDFVKQKEIASELFSKDPHPSEVLKKLEDFQESILFVPHMPKMPTESQASSQGSS